MALVITGLSRGDVAEVIECLLRCTGTCVAPELSAYRRGLADRVGDALKALPASRAEATEGAVK